MKYEALANILHDGTRYGKGSEIELTEQQAHPISSFLKALEEAPKQEAKQEVKQEPEEAKAKKGK